MYRRFQASIWILMIAFLSVLPALADSPGDGTVLVLPYVAVRGVPDGWHFRTLLFMGNPHALSNSGSIAFFVNDGQPLPVRLNDGPELAAQAEWTVSPRRSKLLILTHPGNVLQAGWLRVQPSGKSPVRVTEVVLVYNGEYLAGEAGIQAAPGEDTGSSNYATASQRAIPVWGFQNPSGYQMERALMAQILRSLSKREKRASRLALVGYAVPSSSSSHSRGEKRGSLAPHVVETGYASWYGPSYHGLQAANGAIFDQEKFTAAHRTLPYGTRATVTNLRNRRSVVVRISDRGPFVRGRIVDLSMAAAREIGMVDSGISRVRLEILPAQ